MIKMLIRDPLTYDSGFHQQLLRNALMQSCSALDISQSSVMVNVKTPRQLSFELNADAVIQVYPRQTVVSTRDSTSGVTEQFGSFLVVLTILKIVQQQLGQDIMDTLFPMLCFLLLQNHQRYSGDIRMYLSSDAIKKLQSSSALMIKL